MSGLVSSGVVFVFSLTLVQITTLQAKPLSATVRLRRDLRDSFPYEAQMMSYPIGELKGRGDDLYYQSPVLGQALQRLVESDQRREQEAAYMASLLRLLSDAQNNRQVRPEDEEGRDYERPYPPDYDDTEQKPRPSLQGLDPQLTQALLNRYKQQRLMQAGLNRVQEREQDRDQQMLRYLVEKILSGLASSVQQGGSQNQRSKRDLERSGTSAPKRSRRSLDSVADASVEASLLRVKRLGDEEDSSGQSSRTPRLGLQRMKRIDTDLPPPPVKNSRRRRALTFDPALIAQHILQLLPA